MAYFLCYVYIQKNLDMDQPVISKSTSSYSEGDSLLISCSANANPPRSNSSFSWKSNGQFIAHGAYLKLKNVTKKDSGVYECLVRNSVGVSKGEIIDIQCESSILQYCLFKFKHYNNVIN